MEKNPLKVLDIVGDDDLGGMTVVSRVSASVCSDGVVSYGVVCCDMFCFSRTELDKVDEGWAEVKIGQDASSRWQLVLFPAAFSPGESK